MKKIPLIAIVIIALLASLIVKIQAVDVVKANYKTITVPTDYLSIQAALDNAADGDTIFVKKGTYMENPVINKSVSLVGEGRDATVIDVTTGLKVKRDNVTITGFTISGKGSTGISGGTGISLETNTCNISENKITNVTHGLVLFQSNNSCIAGNIFELIGLSSAIQLNYASSNLITNNYIDSCTEGIQLWQSSANNTVIENTITNCQDPAIRLQYTNDNIITQNNLTYSGIGTSIYVANRNEISNNNYIYNAVQVSANEWYAQTFGYNFSINTINGNYWSDYNGTDANDDGVGDTPYIIDVNNKDNYPFMNPINISTELPSPMPSPSISPSPSITPSPSPTSSPA